MTVPANTNHFLWEEILEDPNATPWLKDAVIGAMGQDCVKSVNDARRLHTAMMQYYYWIVAQTEAEHNNERKGK